MPITTSMWLAVVVALTVACIYLAARQHPILSLVAGVGLLVVAPDTYAIVTIAVASIGLVAFAAKD